MKKLIRKCLIHTGTLLHFTASKLDKRYHYLLISIETDDAITPAKIRYDVLGTLMDVMEFIRQGGMYTLMMKEAYDNNVGPPPQIQQQQSVKSAHYLKQANEVYFVK